MRTTQQTSQVVCTIKSGILLDEFDYEAKTIVCHSHLKTSKSHLISITELALLGKLCNPSILELIRKLYEFYISLEKIENLLIFLQNFETNDNSQLHANLICNKHEQASEKKPINMHIKTNV